MWSYDLDLRSIRLTVVKVVVSSERTCNNCLFVEVYCTNQQPPQRGGAVPGPVWVGSKWLLAFPRVPVTPGTPHSFFRYAAP